MFGHKNAGLKETEPRSRARYDAAKSTRTRRKTENWMAKTTLEARARKETYFALASTFRWSQ